MYISQSSEATWDIRLSAEEQKSLTAVVPEWLALEEGNSSVSSLTVELHGDILECSSVFSLKDGQSSNQPMGIGYAEQMPSLQEIAIFADISMQRFRKEASAFSARISARVAQVMFWLLIPLCVVFVVLLCINLTAAVISGAILLGAIATLLHFGWQYSVAQDECEEFWLNKAGAIER